MFVKSISNSDLAFMEKVNLSYGQISSHFEYIKENLKPGLGTSFLAKYYMDEVKRTKDQLTNTAAQDR